MWAITQAEFDKSRLDIEHEIPRTIYESETIVKRDVCMEFCDSARPLYFETNASSIGLSA